MECLRIRIAILISILLCCFSSAHADGIFLEGGQGFHHSTRSQCLFLSYQRDSSPLFGLDSYYKAELGAWNGQHRNGAFVLAKEIRMTLHEKSYISFEPGAAYLRRTTDNLGTRLQFALRFALGMRTGQYDLSLGYRHFSNGKGVFHWTDTENYGENFVTFQIGCLL
jgi:hypothetical protein